MIAKFRNSLRPFVCSSREISKESGFHWTLKITEFKQNEGNFIEVNNLLQLSSRGAY